MEIKVYANREAQVITEEDFLEKIEILATEYDDNLDAFAEFLSNRYEILEIWDMTEEEKVKAKKLFHEENVEVATDDIECDWFETILEI